MAMKELVRFMIVSFRFTNSAVYGLTGCISCGGWEGGLALETEKAQSQKKAQKTRRVPTVSCTLC
jgi:hypothetical protein